MNKLMLILLCIVAWQTAVAREYPLSSADTNVCSAVVRSSTPAGFTDDMAVACAEAEKSGKKVLAVFSGSDWCRWSGMMEEMYLISNPEFVEEAKKSFELVFIDSSKDELLIPDVAKLINERYVGQCKAKGSPAVKILAADGSEIVDAPLAVDETPKQYVEKLLHATTPEGRYEELTNGIGRDVALIFAFAYADKYSFLFDLGGRVFKPLEVVGTNYLPRCMALRTEVEKMPQDRSQEALLAKIDMIMTMLEKFRDRDAGGLVEMALQRCNNDGCAEEHAGTGWSPLALSFVSSCEFPDEDKDVYGFRLNLLGGRHHDIGGVDVGGVYNSVSNDMYGVQVGGLCNFVANGTIGGQVSGLGNIGGWGLDGLQLGGLFNVAGDVTGAQAAGLLNLCLRMSGCQVSGSGNLAGVVHGCQIGGAGGNVSLVLDGMQIAGEMNSAYGLKGLQCSGIINSCSVLNGMQLSAINLSDDCSGFQLGVFNKSTTMAGVQIGLVNYATTMLGIQVGVCNIIRSSPAPILPVVNMSF